MKFIISLILIALISFAACTVLPWWGIAPASFLVSVLIPQKVSFAFLSGFLSLFILWGGYSWYISHLNEHILAHKVSMLILKNDQPVTLIIITALIGGIVAGLAAVAGSLLRKPSIKNNPAV